MKAEGQIRGNALVDVLRLLCLRQQPTQLIAMRNGATASVVAGQGKIIHARIGALAGEGAVVELLRWREGIFKVSEVAGVPERNVRAPFTELILRAAQPGSASSAGPLSPPAPEEDEIAPSPAERRLDAALTTLFARLEREVARFETLRSSSRIFLAVPALEALLARIVETGAQHGVDGFAEPDLRQLLARQAEITPSLRLAAVEGGRIRLGVFREMLNSSSLGEAQRRQIFDELASGTVGLVNGLFARIARPLRSGDLHAEWQETFEAFLTDLTAALDAVKR